MEQHRSVDSKLGIELAGMVFGGDGTETCLAEKDEDGVGAATSLDGTKDLACSEAKTWQAKLPYP
jgi:hypothetical protein